MRKRKIIPNKTRIEVWEKFEKRCAYCGCELEYHDMQVDHISSVARSSFIKMENSELNDVQNLFPSCRMCNYYKNTNSIEEFRKKLQTTLKETSIKSFQTRLALKYGMVKLDIWDGLFWFEKQLSSTEKPVNQD